jgi:ubiquitin C-terminal hydrolase
MPHLVNYRQQDCQEFLRLFLDSLSEDLYRSTKNAIDTTKTLPALPIVIKTTGAISPNMSIKTSISEGSADQFRLPSTPKSSPFSPRLTNPSIITSSHSSQGLSPMSPSDPSKLTVKSSGSPKSLHLQYEVDFDTPDEKELATDQDPDDHSVSQEQISAVAIENKPISAEQAWESYYKASSSIIVDLFSGQLQSRIECSVCKNSSSCFDPFMELSLPIPSLKPATAQPPQTSFLRSFAPNFLKSPRVAPMEVSKCTLQECMDLFTAEEILDGDNMYHCEKCNAKQSSVKKLYLSRLPDVLLLQFKRFKSSDSSMISMMRSEKINTDISFPICELDLSCYMSPDHCSKSTVYDLFGVSHHYGSLHGGHYMAHANVGAKCDDCSWMCFNDDEVRPITSSSVFGPSAYILFYRLRR